MFIFELAASITMPINAEFTGHERVSPTEYKIKRLHIVSADIWRAELLVDATNGVSVTITGTLRPAETWHYKTPVLIAPEKVIKAEIQP